jgi:hypothetical protein
VELPVFGQYLQATAEKLLKMDFTVPVRSLEEVNEEITRGIADGLKADKELKDELGVGAGLLQSSILKFDEAQPVSFESEYANYWKWLNALYELAEETSAELPVTLQTYYAAAKRCTTKEALIEKIQSGLAHYFRLEKWVKGMMDTMMQMAAHAAPEPMTAEELSELRVEVEPLVTAQVQTIIPALQQRAAQALRANVEMFWDETASVS